MFTLFRTRLMKRLAVGFAGVLLLAVGVFFAIKQNKIEDTNAATGDGANVTVNFDGDLGDPNNGWPKWGGYFESPRFEISNGSSTMPGFCVNASLGVVAHGDVIPARRVSNNRIKLMLYIFTVENSVTNAALSELGISRDNDGFARTHAIVSFINDPDGVWEKTQIQDLNSRVAWMNGVIAKLDNYISTNAEVWQLASGYQLYMLDNARTVGIGAQNVAWIEPMYANIKIQKLDNETGTPTPQGDASLAGIQFKVVNKNNPQDVKQGETGDDGSVTFTGLLVGTSYEVSETTAGRNISYNLDSEPLTVTLTEAGYTFNVKDEVKRGKVVLIKEDKETGSCENKTSELSFAGTKFTITNKSTNPVVIGGTTYNTDSVIETKTFGEDTCSVTFENLPYGKYAIRETEAATGYERNTEDIEVTIPTNNSYSVSKKAEEQPIRGDVTFVKMDNKNGIPMDNTLFSISALDKNNNVKETHLVVSNQDGVVDTSSSFIRHSIHTNGYDALYDAEAPIVFQGYGTWFGIDSNNESLHVNDSLGALPYGTYIIQELKCDANFFCSNIINQKKTIVIDEPNEVVDLGNWDNTCAEFTLSTTASDAKDGDKIVEDSGEVTIKDEVEYCVKAGMDFTIKGILMDKSTGEPLLVNGKTVESQVALKSETDCGTIDMFFTFDSTGLGGKDLVVFEKLYYGEDLLTSHEDLDDEEQTINVFKLKTFAKNKETGEKVLPLDQDVVIEDLVQYCVTPGLKYKISGVLMDKRTGNGVLVNSEPVEQAVIIEPEEACGELVMEYPINTTGLGGADLVFFETLYSYDEGDPEDEEDDIEIELITHKDINNEDETVHVEPPAPDTGYITKANDEDSSTNYTFIFTAGLITLGLGGYAAIRSSAKRRVMKF